VNNAISRATGAATVIGMLLASICGVTLAASKGGALKLSSARADAVAFAATGEQLARFGEQRRDPLLLIAAARILLQAGVQPAEFKKQSRGGQGDARKPANEAAGPEALLARARELASGRSDLIALADEVAKEGARGAVGGPRRGTTVVRTRAVDELSIEYNGGEMAAIAISGDGESDLDIEVIDPAGRVVCRADGPSDQEICRWAATKSGAHRVRIINNGVANEYRVLTN
jgi:hypothetical protein